MRKIIIVLLALSAMALLVAGACSVEPETITATVTQSTTVTTTPAPVTQTITATVNQTETVVQTITMTSSSTETTTSSTQSGSSTTQSTGVALEIDNQAPSLHLLGEPQVEISGNKITITILMSCDPTPVALPFYARCAFLNTQGAEMGTTIKNEYDLPASGAPQRTVMDFEIIGDPAQLHKVILSLNI